MGVPTSEVGNTPAMSRREDHEVHKDMWGHWGIFYFNQQFTKYIFYFNNTYRGADKSVARPGSKKANVSVGME